MQHRIKEIGAIRRTRLLQTNVVSNACVLFRFWLFAPTLLALIRHWACNTIYRAIYLQCATKNRFFKSILTHPSPRVNCLICLVQNVEELQGHRRLWRYTGSTPVTIRLLKREVTIPRWFGEQKLPTNCSVNNKNQTNCMHTNDHIRLIQKSAYTANIGHASESKIFVMSTT